MWIAEYMREGRRVAFNTRTTDRLIARAWMAEQLAGLVVRQTSPYLFIRAHRGGSRFRAKDGLPMVSRAVYRIVRERLSAIARAARSIRTVLRHSYRLAAPRERRRPATDPGGVGHEDIGTTTMYAHVSSSKKRRGDILRYLEGGGAK